MLEERILPMSFASSRTSTIAEQDELDSSHAFGQAEQTHLCCLCGTPEELFFQDVLCSSSILLRNRLMKIP
jgi:hypothetical protein